MTVMELNEESLRERCFKDLINPSGVGPRIGHEAPGKESLLDATWRRVESPGAFGKQTRNIHTVI